MVNRLQFFDSISGIKYPKMMIDFFDHFIALKKIVEDTGSISVDKSTENFIRFSIAFNNPTWEIYSITLSFLSFLVNSFLFFDCFAPNNTFCFTFFQGNNE